MRGREHCRGERRREWSRNARAKGVGRRGGKREKEGKKGGTGINRAKVEARQRGNKGK